MVQMTDSIQMLCIISHSIQIDYNDFYYDYYSFNESTSLILIHFSCKKAKSKRTMMNLLESTSFHLNVILKKSAKDQNNRDKNLIQNIQMISNHYQIDYDLSNHDQTDHTQIDQNQSQSDHNQIEQD